MINFRNEKKKRIVAGTIAILIILAMVVSMIVSAFAEEAARTKGYDLSLNKSAQGVFPRGVSYEGISLEGKTYEEAVEEIQQYVQERIARQIQWDVLGYQYDYDGGSFQTTWSNPEAVEQLKDLTMSGNLIQQYKKQKDLDENPVDLDLQFTINEDLVREQVQAYSDQYSLNPVNASVRLEGGQFIVTEAVNGISFDVEAISSAIVAELEDFSTAEDIQYSFPFAEIPAEYNSSCFNFSSTPLGSYTTTKLGDASRKNNIAVSAANMNGHVFYPGEAISTLAMFGSITTDAGYTLAPGYNQGQQEMTVGGGICQTTTTLYNAVLRAELTVTYRRNHSMMVSYVSPALDATVAPPYSDFTFVNSTNYPIYIESYVSGDSVTVNIWGVEERPANRTIAYESVITSLTWPELLYNQIVDDSVCTYGNVNAAYKVKTYIDPHPAIKATSYKHVYIDGVETEVIKLNEDSYVAMTGTLYHASDCTVTASVYADSSQWATYPYMGWSIHIGTWTLTGEEWPYYP